MRLSASDFLLKSPRVPVRFAGFESTTHMLQVQGWQLAIERDWQRDALVLVAKHEPATLYMLSRPMDAGHFRTWSTAGMEMAMEQTGFDIIRVSSGMHFQVTPHSGPLKFEAIDATPSYEPWNDTKIIDLEELRIFKPLNIEAEIIVEESSVSELLDLIQKKQAPTQAEIRERLRKEKLREDVRGQLLGNRFSGYDPRKDIRAQLVCLSS